MPTTREQIAATLPAPPGTGGGAGFALFLDVDGTLLDFAHHPDGVDVDARLRVDLLHIRGQLGGAVALLSGRPLAQLDALFHWDGQPAAGLHGAELRTPDGCEHVTGDAGTFAQLRSRAASLAGAAPGVMLEDKRLALALHYRHAPTARNAAERIMRALLHDSGNRYAVQRGDYVIELKPAGVDKGRALATLMGHAPFRGRTPWMLGDDLTDEDAFRSVNAHGGTSVIVGPRRPTAARHALSDPARVREWLHALARG
ncbi:MAG TPA: trehalose-phosphatase [Rhodanobacteraceae bacterium]|nr:trehalose-phosphatase [Rhodanobacteraceae bacterium]